MDKSLTDSRPIFDGSGDPKKEGDAEPKRAPVQTKPNSIEMLYARYADQLSASLRKMYGDGPPDPEDVSQQAFQKLIERGDLGSIANLRAFLWRTARNIVLAAKRSQDVRSRYDFEVEQLYFPLKDDETTPERIIVVRDQLRAISEALRNMPAKRRRVVILHRVEGMSLADIGRKLGISRQVAAKHLAKGTADINVMIMNDEES